MWIYQLLILLYASVQIAWADDDSGFLEVPFLYLPCGVLFLKVCASSHTWTKVEGAVNKCPSKRMAWTLSCGLR